MTLQSVEIRVTDKWRSGYAWEEVGLP